MEKKLRKVYENTRKVNNYRELITTTVDLYSNNIAYKYKRNVESSKIEYIEKTYLQMKEDIEALGSQLLELGFENKRIALIGKNRYEWCVSYLATTTSNIVIVPLDKALPEKELKLLIQRSRVEAIIFDSKYKEIVKKIKENNNNNLNTLICMDNEFIDDREILTISKLLSTGKELILQGKSKYNNINIDKDKMSVMLFTSGTTSKSKAVMLSQYNICSNINSLSTWVKLYPTDVLLSFLPMHHTFECTITFLYGFYSGATVAFCDGLKYIQKNLTEYNVSVFVAVPLVLETMYKKIIKTIDDKGKTKTINSMVKISNILLKYKIDIRKKLFKQILDNFGGSLRIILYGSAPMDKNTITGYNDFGIDMIQGYGLTETSPVISAETDKEKRPGSVGLVFDDLKVKIEGKNEDGIGEIVIKGPNIMLGYYENEEETKKVLKNGWFKTGDYGYIDNDGFLYVTGRKKDIIILKNGKNVYPQELEFLINKIPYVDESLVYQREKDNIDTMLCAKIIYNKQNVEKIFNKISEEELKEHIWQKIKEINKELPIYKHIKQIEITEEPLEKTTTQKVKRQLELQKIIIKEQSKLS